ncbi:DUF3618 domain-containing protein [Rhodosalinus sediminis]|uniref:DUF3618 domain-containing protein n=1 Tax=Rhodosalinus sediminis TaxID=1940533 RepID=A0A3D9BPN3_9RHOB|nr:DUF3618 domain-containing protein [Rhodosalinus sediminis]REC55479.1 DUF3618 domain-containing protein [Rhodosalinus sediminis]
MEPETPEEIATDIAARRAALGRRIAALEARATPERLLRETGARLAAEGGALGRRAGREMAANPLATAAVLGGLAWLALGAARGQPGESAERPATAGARRPRGWRRLSALITTATAGSRIGP